MTTTPAPSFIRYESLTKAQFDRLDRARAVVFATCSPIEVHGPHLPMGADALESEGLAERTIRALPERHRGRTFVKMPPLFLGSDVVPQPGSMFFRPSTITAVLEDLGRSLAHAGFRDIVLTSFHGSPRHFLAMEEACARVNRRCGTRMISLFSLLLARLSGGAGNIEDVFRGIEGLPAGALKDDAHAGFVETSQLLALHKEWVGKDFEKLPQLTLEERGRAGKNGVGDLLAGIRAAVRHFEENTYLGAPAAATAELGEKLLATLGAKGAEALAEVLDGTLLPGACHSPIWKLKALFLTDWLIPLGNALVGYRPPRK